MAGTKVIPKVFISCGQHTDGERRIAREIADELSNLGFEPYVAIVEQTVEGLKNNLFRQLETSEYFLFIDFKREQLANTGNCRGSLFTNQELGIASFLGIEAIGFQEIGVKPLDGMLGVMQLNAETFDGRDNLCNRVLERVKAQWRTGWRKGLTIEPGHQVYNDAQDAPQSMKRFHFLAVRNLHDRQLAHDCQVFPLSVRNISDGAELLKAVSELKWSGYMYPSARIRQGTARLFDAIVVPHAKPHIAWLHGFTDSTDYITVINGPGEFEVKFEATCSNLPPVRQTAKITLGRTIRESTVSILGGYP